VIRGGGASKKSLFESLEKSETTKNILLVFLRGSCTECLWWFNIGRVLFANLLVITFSDSIIELGLHDSRFGVQKLVNNDVISTSGGVSGYNMFDVRCAHATDF